MASMPHALLCAVAIPVLIHAKLFHYYICQARDRVEKLGRESFLAARGPGHPQYIRHGTYQHDEIDNQVQLSREMADMVVRNQIWFACGESATQANLMVVAQASDGLVKETYAALTNEAHEPGSSLNSNGAASGHLRTGQVGHSTHGDARIETSAIVGPMRIIVRVVLNTELKLWFKISMLAHGFEELGPHGREKLLLAIAMGLLSVALAIWDFATSRPSHTLGRECNIFPTFVSVGLFIMLAFRLYAVYFWCTSRIFNFISMSCSVG